MTRGWCPFPLTILALAVSSCGPTASRLEDMNSLMVTLPSGKKILCQTMVRDIDLLRGMMFQDSLPPERGMLLMHPTEAIRPTYTYNVKIPLDFIWLDQNQRVVEMAEKAPPCTTSSAKQCPLYGGRQKSRYVLELNAGQAAANGLKIGDSVAF